MLPIRVWCVGLFRVCPTQCQTYPHVKVTPLENACRPVHRLEDNLHPECSALPNPCGEINVAVVWSRRCDNEMGSLGGPRISKVHNHLLTSQTEAKIKETEVKQLLVCYNLWIMFGLVVPRISFSVLSVVSTFSFYGGVIRNPCGKTSQ